MASATSNIIRQMMMQWWIDQRTEKGEPKAATALESSPCSKKFVVADLLLLSLVVFLRLSPLVPSPNNHSALLQASRQENTLRVSFAGRLVSAPGLHSVRAFARPVKVHAR